MTYGYQQSGRARCSLVIGDTDWLQGDDAYSWRRVSADVENLGVAHIVRGGSRMAVAPLSCGSQARVD
jgi:hypothetical protein